MSPRHFVVVYINGNRREVSGKKAIGTLLSYLRYEERLTGTKLGCGEGGCGACTILYSYYDHLKRRICHRSVNACLMPVAACDGAAITTIEAVGNIRDGLAPIQEALANAHGSQCGFCTPGIVMSMFALLREHGTRTDPLTPLEVEKNFDGNLCRCTGYRPILDAYKGLLATKDAVGSAQCAMGEQCCRVNGSQLGNPERALHQKEEKKISPVLDREYIFPPELIEYRPAELNLADGNWLRPVTLEQLMRLKTEHPEAKLVVGNTELGVEVKFKNLNVPVWINVAEVPELQEITEDDVGVKVGASVTWTRLSNYVSEAVKRSKLDGTLKLYQLSSLQAIQSQLELFAGKQIRNVGTIAGNIVTASPISDINPLLLAACAFFTVLDCKTGKKRSVRARDFFVSYRKVDLKEGEIIVQVVLPWNMSEFDFTYPFKVSRRREDDIAIVSAGIRLRLALDPKLNANGKPSFTIEAAHIGLGGIAPTTISMDDVERVLTGKPFNESSLKEGMVAMARSTVLPKDVPGGMPEYRQSLSVGFLFKAFVATARAVNKRFLDDDSILCTLGFDNVQDTPSMSICERSVSQGVQIFSDCEPLSKGDITGKPIPHLSAALQVSGEAKYIDDIPRFDGELQAALVLSSEPHARILEVDYSDAEKIPGVYEIIDVKNVKGRNLIGPKFFDECCFADKEVTTIGQVVALVTAETVEQAREAVRRVRVTYDPLPAVVTIEDAIESDSYAELVPPRFIQKGNARSILQRETTGAKLVRGRVRIGAQEHWYLEPNGTIAVPDENGEMLILASTQSPGKTQATVSRVLGQQAHKVVCKVKRIGGGFGGKETRSCFLSAAVAVAAQSTSRPVRLVLDRDVDMMITGTRHAFLADYQAAYEATGRIVALSLEIYLNMGNTVDLSAAVLDRALYHAVNCYDIPNVDIIGKACYTNTTSSTAFRGFGGPQGMMICENVIDHVAFAVKLPPERVRDVNMFGRHGNASVTPYGMNVNTVPLHKCWEGVLGDSKYSQRRKDVDYFNSKHSYRKRGLSVIPTMFGISFTFSPLNQAGALVHIYQEDGSVLISHGGVEMGQGLHTKMCQVAASELQIPLEKVFVSETATDKIPNASPTAASASSDLYGMAVLRACRTLKERLEPFKSEPGISWEETVSKAWANRVSLFATGFYKTPGLDDVNLTVPGAKGNPFSYFTNGSAASEVEIDVLTGEMKLIRTDIVMDIGRPLNPAIDVGQIEGAFVQGLGWCTMEEFVRGSKNEHIWLKEGKVFTLGPGTYKIPAFGDVPQDFRVRVLDGRNESDTICSSKAIGEPPLFLAASVFFAIRDAISHSRHQHNLHDWFALDSPASVERIRLKCIDGVVSSVLPNTGSAKPSLSL